MNESLVLEPKMRRTNNTLSEKDFLKKLIITPFNFYKGSKFDISEINIRSILPRPGYRLGYELNTIRRNDYFRIRAYFNIARSDSLSPFELQLEETPDGIGNLSDEIFVTTGSIDSAHHLYEGYPFQWITDHDATLPLLIQTDGMPFLLVGGGYILLT